MAAWRRVAMPRSARGAPARSGGIAAGRRRRSCGHRGRPPLARPRARRFCPLRTMDRRADRAGPGPELGGDDLDALETRGEDVPPNFVADRVEQQVRGRRHTAAQDHPLWRDRRDHVGDADPEITTDPFESGASARVTGAGALDCLLDALRPACLGDPVRSGVGLETTAVAAAARRALGIERLVTHLAARAVATLIDAAIEGGDRDDTG